MDCSRGPEFQLSSYHDGPYFSSEKLASLASGIQARYPYNNSKLLNSHLQLQKSCPSSTKMEDDCFPFSQGEQMNGPFQYIGDHYSHQLADMQHPIQQASAVSPSQHQGMHLYLRPQTIGPNHSVIVQPNMYSHLNSSKVDSYLGPMVNGSVDHYTGRQISHHFGDNQKVIPSSSPSDGGSSLPEITRLPSAYDGQYSYPHRYESSSCEFPTTNFGFSSPSQSSSLNSGTMHYTSLAHSGPGAMQHYGINGNKSSFHKSGMNPTPTVPLSRDSDVDQVDETHKCKNTVEGTKTSVRRFKKWYRDRYGKNIDMNSINRFNAPELLKDFFLEIRDTRPGRIGNEYEPVTLTTYRNGLRRYFLYRKTSASIDNFDLTDKSFDIVNRRLMSKRDDLKRKGKGNHPNAIESITPEQLEKMWHTGAIGIHAPRPLLRLQWWLNTIFHGVRGRMAHHDLSVEDFRMSRSPDGKLCIEYIKGLHSRSMLKLDITCSSKSKRKGPGRVYETDGGDRDPVRAFEIYKSHRPDGISSFYLTPKHKPKGNVWFNKVPMGKNSIGRIMREIKAIAGMN